MKKTRKLQALWLAMLVLLVIFAEKSFASTYKTYGQVLFELGMVKGSNGDLLEQSNISREEMVTILTRLSGSEELNSFVLPSQATFLDVPKSHWAFKNIEWAYRKGITTGVSADRFGLGEKVTYNQVSLLLLRSLGYDTANISFQKASEEIEKMYGLGLKEKVYGDKNLYRGEVFELLAKTLLMKEKSGAVKIEGLYPADKVAAFRKNMEIALTDKGFFQSSPQVGEFELKSTLYVSEWTREMVLGSNLKEKYLESHKQRKAINDFVNQYLQAMGEELSIKLSDIAFQKTEIIELENDEVFFDINTQKFYGNATEMRIRFEGNGLIIESKVDDSAKVMTSTGSIAKIKKYPKWNGKQVFALFGTEKVKRYQEHLRKEVEMNRPFYLAFTVEADGEIAEAIGKFEYGMGVME